MRRARSGWAVERSRASAARSSCRRRGRGVTKRRNRRTTDEQLAHDPYVLPEGLPAPVDDGAAAHLPGLRIPNVVLRSSRGNVQLSELAAERLVLYVYPETG